MNTKLISRTRLFAIFASLSPIILIATFPAYGETSPVEFNEAFGVHVLAESGWTYPSLEEFMSDQKQNARRLKTEEPSKVSTETGTTKKSDRHLSKTSAND